MLRTLHTNIKLLTLIIAFLFIAKPSSATHIYGADLFYTHVSNNTYNITLVIYGDCSGAAFNNLINSSAQVNVYNGSTLYTSLTLIQQSPVTGTEVTPVCASQINNTACNGGTLPGVKKFTYSRNVTLNTTSSNWRFRFTGNLGSTSSAGRSTSITNISNSTGSSIMNLEATLNNTNGSNSSPTYTTIPTPFFCINKAANYNPGTVDPNNDSLVYSMVPGLTQVGTVTYLTGYSATAPLAASTGTFSFSNTTGQLAFTPNLVQRSLVVNRVDEYKNGVLVGTSMREMTFVVLNNCNNNPPGGAISNNNGGTIVNNGLGVIACQSVDTLGFKINPTDLDNDNITMSVAGLPAGASFVVTSNGGTAPSAQFTWSVANAAPGSYNFFVTYLDNGCPLSSKQTQAYTITILPDPKLAYAVLSPITCTKKEVFSMTPSVSPSPWTITITQGGSSVHTFTNLTSAQIDSLAAGTYTFRVTNSNSCFTDTTITIAEPPAIIPSITEVKPTCVGDSNGSITIVGTGGKSPFRYRFGTTGTYGLTNTFGNLPAGTYTLSIRDANDCEVDTNYVLQDPPDIGANITFVQPPCNYYNSGVITVNAFNGTTPYEYALGTGAFSTTNTYSGLFSGTYIIHIRDSNNCKKDTTFALIDSVKVTATAALTHILCNGDSTGAVAFTASGAQAPYKYQWLPSGPLTTNNTFNNLPAGTLNFHIEDDNKCYLDTAITLNQPDPLLSPVSITTPLCNSDTNGSFTINASGGVSPYTFAIGSGTYSGTSTFTNLGAGTYTIHVKDDNNCIKDSNIIIIEPAELAIASLPISEPTCFSSLNGSITVTATGGTTPYQYRLNTGSYGSSNAFGTLPAGSYNISIRDNNNCQKDTTVALQQPPQLIPQALTVKSTCVPINNGEVTMSATGGTPGYQYALGAGAFSSNATFTTLASGSYTFRVRDNNNCTEDTIVAVVDSIVIDATLNLTDALCLDSNSGAIVVNPTGGTSPYQYALGTGPYGNSNAFNNQYAGTYTVHIRDTIGCEMDTTISLTEPNRLQANLILTRPLCNGDTNGVITINAIGGTAAYTFAANNGSYQNSNALGGLAAGTHTIKILDNNNCYFDTSIELTQPDSLKYTLSIRDVLCKDDTTGRVTITPIGGTPPYIYTSGAQVFGTIPTIYGLDSGIHIIRLQDANGCLKDSTILISEPNKFYISNFTFTAPTCEGFENGTISLSAMGGVDPYTYALGGGNFGNSGTFNNVPQGNYTITAKDANGCEEDTTVNLQGLPPIILNDVLPDAVSCYGYADGSLTIDAEGGVQPLRYQVGGDITSNNKFENLKSGSYTVTIIDSADCTKDTTISITEPEELIVKATATPNDCEGYDDEGVIKAEVTGGTTPYQYTWSNGTVDYSPELRGMGNGTYSVVVSDFNDCTDTTSATIVYNNCCKIFIPDAFTPNGDGRNDRIKILFKGDFELIEFSIYNRFGQQVYTTTNFSDRGWDGRFNGVLQDLGTYNYYAKGICGNGGDQEVEYKGTITLIH